MLSDGSTKGLFMRHNQVFLAIKFGNLEACKSSYPRTLLLKGIVKIWKTSSNNSSKCQALKAVLSRKLENKYGSQWGAANADKNMFMSVCETQLGRHDLL